MNFEAQSIQNEYFYQLDHLSSFNPKSILLKEYELCIQYLSQGCESKHIMI